ncbi:MAG: UDP-N-acetylmuramoyl-L-alanine--D-glutamate ligase [Patescibacteria group bacterium]
MKDWRKFFKGKKITQMGLGLLGRGVGDAEFLAKYGADLLVTDLKTEKELAPSLKKLKSYKLKALSYVLGEHRLKDFRHRPKPLGDGRGPDFILKAAGVPLDSLYMAEARKQGIPIEMDASLFFKLMPKDVTFIGVTGTRGKTTTAYLIYEILKTNNKKVFLAGNIKDTATLPFLEKVKAGDFVVAELDSWQLQGFGDAKLSPPISVFTTFLPDHMNYYKGDMNLYFKDKANIFKYQKKGDILIFGDSVVEAACHLGAQLPSSALIARAVDLPTDWKLKIIGEHNRYNAACALAVARALKIPDEISKEAIENFGGVPGRLEFIREIRDVRIYNDTCATTPDATMAALRALSSKQIILILGGSDKGLDMSKLVAEIPKYCKGVVLLPGTGTEKLISNSKFLISNQTPISNVKNLREAVKKTVAIAKRSDIILFSPALASFGMFKNEYDRGEQFNVVVKSLR